ncbi:lipocalin family protein [Bacteroidota bacterium]
MNYRTLMKLFVINFTILFFLYGCSKNETNPLIPGIDELVGAWELISVTVSVGDETETFTPEEFELLFSMTLNSDYTQSRTIITDGNTFNLAGNWDIEGNTLVLTEFSGNQTDIYFFSLNENILLLSFSGYFGDEDATYSLELMKQ